MADSNISRAISSNLSETQTDFSVPKVQIDNAGDTKETTWINNEFTQYMGYYKTIPELKSAINAIARWTVGKGFKADETTEINLDQIKGWGKDTFNTIIENMIRTYHIGGDAYAEIIRDKDDNIINLKSLDPTNIQHVVNKQGMIIRFEQINKNTKTPFQPNEIFYLPRNRVADEIHGDSMIKALEWTILAMNEAKQDMKILMHRHVKPMRIWKVDEDDPTAIANFKTTVDSIQENAENLFIPKDVVETEIASVAPNQTLNPLPWLERLRNDFYQACGVPQIIVGGSSEFTEATAKIAYLAFQQTIEEEQLFLEEQILTQLNIVVEFEFPASLENELLSDQKKDGAENIDPSETTAGEGQ